MGKRAPSATQGISLFPFLAVLLCAMGALILLLLVTTRRIRQQQAERAGREMIAHAESVLQKPPVPVIEARAEIPERQAAPWDVPLTPLLAPDPLPAPPDPNDDWRARLQALTAQQAKLAAAVVDEESKVEQHRAASLADARELESLIQQSSSLDGEKKQIEQSFDELQRQQTNSEAGALVLRRKIDETREQLAKAESRFAVIPFDGRLGTTRRPIIIECTEQGITFASEGVTLHPEDLNGFTPRYNPLLLATRALANYWDRKDGRISSGDEEGDPYVLLIVRPQGTIAYYVARAMLGQWNESFGYELVRDDQQFAWPETDAAAVTICRTIVERMLSERETLRAGAPELPPGRAGRFSDGDGSFRLEEVERLRNPEQEFTINGRRFGRDLSDFQESAAESSTWAQSHAGSRSGNGGETLEQESENASGPDSRDGDSDRRSGPKYMQALGLRDSITPPGAPAKPAPGAIDRQAVAGAKLLSPDGTPPGTDEDGSSSSSAPPQQPSPFPVQFEYGRRTPPGNAMSNEPPQWGLRPPGGTIGLEREVLVRVSAAQVAIGDETAFPITPGLSADDLRVLLSQHLNHHIRSWGEPPRSFYWLPSIKFIVSPGGTQYYVRLKAIVERWALRSSVEQVLE